MELKPNMYVRTKYGIAKIIEFRNRKNNLSCYYLNKNIIGEEKYLSNCIYDYKYYEQQILSASHNIIDLIEEGDYVNGYKVYSGGKKHFDYILTWDEQNNYYMKIDLLTVNIKSIVTKEQFDSMKYVVERDTNENI